MLLYSYRETELLTRLGQRGSSLLLLGVNPQATQGAGLSLEYVPMGRSRTCYSLLDLGFKVVLDSASEVLMESTLGDLSGDAGEERSRCLVRGRNWLP